MKLDRDLKLRALSDLMITRLRRHFSLPYLGSDNTPPGLLNDAFMFDGPTMVSVVFSDSGASKYAYNYNSCGLHIGLDSLHTSTFDNVTREIDRASDDFASSGSPTSQIARLILQFGYGSREHVDRDIRQLYLEPIIESLDGHLTYTPSTKYPMKIDVGDWNPHPDGIDLAWEGEYVFHEPVSVPKLASIVKDAYDSNLRLDWPNRLPMRTIDGIDCAISVTTRFH